ncbi:MAG: MerR family transcriptional regulator [SAR324 cluster bacterium]|nr:MerR family transcriptional regulator [SAR324 cluster bacterium]
MPITREKTRGKAVKKEKRYSIEEVVEQFGICKRTVIYCIEQEWLEPADPEEQQLDQEDVARLSLICELQEKMGVNDEAVPIILHLVDQIHYLQVGIQKRDKYH